MKRRRPQTPRSAKEWQRAVNGAEALLLLDSARQYGLVEGGPKVHVERCAELLEEGRKLGYRPKKSGVDQFVRTLAEGSS